MDLVNIAIAILLTFWAAVVMYQVINCLAAIVATPHKDKDDVD